MNHRLRLLVPLFAVWALLCLQACESSLGLDPDHRKEIPLDPPGSVDRVRPDSVAFRLDIRDGWSDRTIRLQPISTSIDAVIDTSLDVPLLWASVSCELNDTIRTQTGLRMLLLRSVHLRVDSVNADRIHQLHGDPASGTGTNLRLLRIDDSGVPYDTLDVIPPSQPSQVQSYATLSLTSTSNGTSGVKTITGAYTCTAIVYDLSSQQTLSVPLEGLLITSYR